MTTALATPAPAPASRSATGVVVEVDRVALPGVPVWFTESFSPGAEIPTATLAVCSGGPVLPGTVVPPRLPAGAHCLGRLRWQVRSGLVESLTVAPDWRGRGLGRLLGATADAVATRRGWPALTGRLDERVPARETAWGVERLMAARVTRLL